MDPLTLPDSLSLISAPMVNQSDLPFRLLTRKHGATLTYTQMLNPHRLVNDPEDLEFCRGDELGRPVVVQLYGNDPEVVVKGARKVERLCDAIGVLLLGGYVL